MTDGISTTPGQPPGAPPDAPVPAEELPPEGPRVYGTDENEVYALDDTQRDDVWVPEWGKWYQVIGLTGTQRDAWEASLLRETDRRGRPKMDYSNLRAKLIVRTVVKPGTDEPVFSSVSKLGGKSASALQRIFEVAQRLSRLTDEDVEELTGEFSGGRSSGNGSTPPLSSTAP